MTATMPVSSASRVTPVGLHPEIEALPREDSGKVRKRLLRDEWLAELDHAG